jgi:hypothetical protein
MGGKIFPRRAVRRKIPVQAMGDKEYFSGTFACKICDKKDSPASLWHSEILGVVHTPSEVNSIAPHHSGVCPLAVSR